MLIIADSEAVNVFRNFQISQTEKAMKLYYRNLRSIVFHLKMYEYT